MLGKVRKRNDYRNIDNDNARTITRMHHRSFHPGFRARTQRQFDRRRRSVLILDACGCFEPSRVSRCAPHSTGLLHILRTSSVDSYSEIWSRLQAIQRDLQARQILVVGLLDRLYDPGILTRDASRTLGGIKAKLEHLAENGFDITVLCQSQAGPLGTRSHILSLAVRSGRSGFGLAAYSRGATIFVTRPTLVSPAYRLSCLSKTQ